jgi:hypothetical protein
MMKYRVRVVYACFLFLIAVFTQNLFAQTQALQMLEIEWRSFFADQAEPPFARGLAWSPDSALVASADYALRTLSIFSVEESRVVRTI